MTVIGQMTWPGMTLAAALTLAVPGFAAEPSDVELKVARCLGMYEAMASDIAEDAQKECAVGASQMFAKNCTSEIDGFDNVMKAVGRARDFLAARQLSVSNRSMALALKLGKLDYMLTMGSDHACVRAPMIVGCDPMPGADEALVHLNSCPPVIRTLPP